MKAFKPAASKFLSSFVCLLAIVLASAFSFPASMPTEETIESKNIKPMPRDQEIAMALSAAPVHLRKDATVYVLENGKYAKVRKGTNGFHCLVVRFGDIIAPYAYDQEGAETLMQADFRRAELIAQGKKLQEAQKIIAKEFKSGKLIAPRRSGVAYMLSADFVRHDHKTGKESQVFPPHVMFYAPYLKNSDIGALPEHFNSPDHVYVLNEGQPGALLIVVPKSNPAETKK